MPENVVLGVWTAMPLYSIPLIHHSAELNRVIVQLKMSISSGSGDSSVNKCPYHLDLVTIQLKNIHIVWSIQISVFNDTSWILA